MATSYNHHILAPSTSSLSRTRRSDGVPLALRWTYSGYLEQVVSASMSSDIQMAQEVTRNGPRVTLGQIDESDGPLKLEGAITVVLSGAVAPIGPWIPCGFSASSCLQRR